MSSGRAKISLAGVVVLVAVVQVVVSQTTTTTQEATTSTTTKSPVQEESKKSTFEKTDTNQHKGQSSHDHDDDELKFVEHEEDSHSVDWAERSASMDDKSGPIIFNKQDLFGLSFAEREAKPLPLEAKCEFLEKHLRKMVENKLIGSSSLDRAELFQRVIESLAERRVPFSSDRDQQPYLGPLRECVEELPSYQSRTGSSSRTVVAGPNYARNILEKVDPIKNMNNEFAQVKERVVDFGQDLYAPKAGIKQQDETHSGGHVEEHDHESDSEYDYKHKFEHDDKHTEQYGSHGFGRGEARAYGPMDPDLMKGILEEELLDEKIENERDPMKKLQMELAREKDKNKKLMQQLEDNLYEIDELQKKNTGLEKFFQEHDEHEHNVKSESHDQAASSDSRCETMKSMYEQASEREKATYAKLEEAEKRLASFEGAKTSKHHDDDDSVGDQFHTANSALSDLERTSLATRYKLMKSMYEQASERERATNAKLEDALHQLASLQEARSNSSGHSEVTQDYRGKDDDDDDSDSDDDDDDFKKGSKDNKDVEKIARKLKDKLSSKETLESKCHKFWLLFNYPSEVNKKVIKTVAKLVVPEIDLNEDMEFYNSLGYYVNVLTQSKNKEARSIGRELEMCQPGQGHPSHFHQPASPYPSQRQQSGNHFYHEVTATSSSSGGANNNVPVTFVRTSSGNRYSNGATNMVPPPPPMPPMPPMNFDTPYGAMNPGKHPAAMRFARYPGGY